VWGREPPRAKHGRVGTLGDVLRELRDQKREKKKKKHTAESPETMGGYQGKPYPKKAIDKNVLPGEKGKRVGGNVGEKESRPFRGKCTEKKKKKKKKLLSKNN